MIFYNFTLMIQNNSTAHVFKLLKKKIKYGIGAWSNSTKLLKYLLG